MLVVDLVPTSIMAPRRYHLDGLVGLGDEVTIASFHPRTLYLPASILFSSLVGLTIVVYCFYSLIGYLSIKPRGLVQDVTLRTVYWTPVVFNSLLLLSLCPFHTTFQPNANMTCLLVQAVGGFCTTGLLLKRGVEGEEMFVVRLVLNAVGLVAFLCLSVFQGMLEASTLTSMFRTITSVPFCLALSPDIVQLAWRYHDTYLPTSRSHTRQKLSIGERHWCSMQTSSGT